MKNTYKIELAYGYVTSESDCDVYHAFMALDPNRKDTNYDKVAEGLAEMLDTTSNDPDFSWDSMDIELPIPLVKTIQAEASNGKK